jgi:hypothetical protein
MKLFLDFDHTLFDCDRFIADISQVGDLTEYIMPATWEHYDARTYLFPDTLDWLRSKNRSDLHIVTAITSGYGEQAGLYQRAKVKSSGVVELVQSVVYVEDDKGAAVLRMVADSLDEVIVFVDDRIEHCLSVKAAVPQSVCCLMVRDPATIGTVSTVQGMYVVHCLTDVDAIIEQVCEF